MDLRRVAVSMLSVLLGILIVVASAYATDQYTYDVYPENECPTGVNCLSLSDIANDQDKYLTSNVTLLFHPGEHRLHNGMISLANVSNLTLHGSKSDSSTGGVTILCVNSSFAFAGVFNLQIGSINFVSCKAELSYTTAVFENSQFENSTSVSGEGGAVAVYNGSFIQFRACSFISNGAFIGGAIAVMNSEVHFLDWSRSVNNSAVEGGGAVYANDAILLFLGKTTFGENTSPGGTGGALHAENGTTITFTGESDFDQNTAAGNGGAIYAQRNNSVNLAGRIRFSGNEAGDDGGALAAFESNELDFSGDAHFVANTAGSGGALFVSVFNRVTFRGNTSSMQNGRQGIICDVLQVRSWNNSTGNFVFEQNMDHIGGTVYAEENNDITFIGNSTFLRNEAVYHGSALYVHHSNTLNLIGSSTIKGNQALGGTVYAYQNNTVNIIGDSVFENNTIELIGGALTVWTNNNLNVIGTSWFSKTYGSFISCSLLVLSGNNIVLSGDISNMFAYLPDIRYCKNLNLTGKYYFEQNDGGAVYAGDNNNVTFSGSGQFVRNQMQEQGGGAAIRTDFNNKVSFDGDTTFTENMAQFGGVLLAYQGNSINFNGTSTFNENSAMQSGGSLCLLQDNNVEFYGVTTFFQNNATLGGAVYTAQSNVTFTDIIVMNGNQASHGGAIFVLNGKISFNGTGHFVESSVTQGKGAGGVILAIGNTVQFQGTYLFANNTADIGGAIAIFDTIILLEPNSNLSFYGNSAQLFGGAFYVQDDRFTYCDFSHNTTTTHVDFRNRCFFQFLDPMTYDCTLNGIPSYFVDGGIYNLYFQNNLANQSGNAIFGGQLDRCKVCFATSDSAEPNSAQGLQVYRELTGNNGTLETEMSSQPYKVCVCYDGQPNCSQRNISVEQHPGQVLVISLVTVGQADGIASTSIIAVGHNLTDREIFQPIQPTTGNNNQCTGYRYPLDSSEETGTLLLYADWPCSTSGFPLTVDVTFLPCPVGFVLTEYGTCGCDDRLQRYTQSCEIDSMTIRRESGDTFWMGIDNNSGSLGLILHPHCPINYCTDQTVNIALNDTDLQCSHGRSGILCGNCQPGRSFALGSSRCLTGCSNKYLGLLVVFALAGVVLVVFLFLFQLTVAGGTLSGLIFYANVLTINQSIFFPFGTTNILTVFIAWLNLDLGIETCFLVGLDTYWKIWLQFVFPIYIWLLVGLIIVLAEYVTTFARLLSKANPIAVLSTLFLLSYTKLIRAFMYVFKFTALEYPDGDIKVVWAYDGNVGYFEGKHIPLFIVSVLMLLVVFLPYTLILFCGQWIMKKSNPKWLSSSKQLHLKAFLDAHYAPFKDNSRYWTGLLLVLRFAILLVSTLTNLDIADPPDPYILLGILLGILSGMLIWLWLAIHRLYKHWCLDVLEASFIFNLLIVIGGTYQIRVSGGNQAALIYTSNSVAFVTFIGILVAAIVQQMKRTKACCRHGDDHEEFVNPSTEECPPSNRRVTKSSVNMTDLSVSDRYEELSLLT